jgi:aspartate racemase
MRNPRKGQYAAQDAARGESPAPAEPSASAEHPVSLLLIGGGVGPMAGVVLHRRVIENTRTDGTDQDHLEVLHLSRSPLVGDRTDFLAGKAVVDPVAGMLQVFRSAALILRAENRNGVAGIPCNTFHAPAIFQPFLSSLHEEEVPVRVLSMLEETAEFVRTRHPGVKRVGLLSTTGTRASGVYREVFRQRDLQLVEVPAEMQDSLHETIYHPEWGLKARSAAVPPVEEKIRRYLRTVISAGAEVVILGCTELPLAVGEGLFEGVPLIDPMTALARALVREVAPGKLFTLPPPAGLPERTPQKEPTAGPGSTSAGSPANGAAS